MQVTEALKTLLARIINGAHKIVVAESVGTVAVLSVLVLFAKLQFNVSWTTSVIIALFFLYFIFVSEA